MNKTDYAYIALSAQLEIAKQLKEKYDYYLTDAGRQDHLRPSNPLALSDNQAAEIGRLQMRLVAMDWLYKVMGQQSPSYREYKKGKRNGERV